MENRKSKQIILSIIGVAILIVAVVGVSFAFFNYTRTGSPNTIQVGRIAFNSTQDNTIILENVFPTSSTNLNSNNSDTVTINITGDTTYSEGIEYKVTLEAVNNTINGKEVPISFNVTASNLGTKDSSYYTNRGGATPIYNLTETGQVEDGKYILVGYIPSGSTGVNGSIDITAFIDGDRVAISDTVSRIENGNLIYGETLGDWIAGRTVFTTTEWNSFNSNPLSFKVRVEANEGIWIEEEPFFVMKNLALANSGGWQNFRTKVTSIEFHNDGMAPTNSLATLDMTDVTSKGTVTLHAVDDGLGNNTYKAIIVADDTIYAPENSSNLFYNMTKLVTFNSANFRVDNVTTMDSMFRDCTSLTNINSLINWNISNVMSMYQMFRNCTSLTNINSLINWNTSNVTNMGSMLNSCTSLSNINGLINWNVSNVTAMSGMFFNCSNLVDISVLRNWNVFSVENMEALFCNCTNLIDFSPLVGWSNKTGNVTNMAAMFGMDSSKTKAGNPVIDFSCLTNWNVSKVENMSLMFMSINIKSYLPFKNWNVSKVQDFKEMFNQTNASSVTTLEGLENWNVSSATNMNGMFMDNVSLTDASAINNWNINANINYENMFEHTPVHPEFTQVSGTWDSEGTFTPNA